jgi:hypothetical protein
VVTKGTSWEGTLTFDADEVIAATGFQAPLGDLPELGLVTLADGRLPALTPFWESISLPGIFFAGNITQGERGLPDVQLGRFEASASGEDGGGHHRRDFDLRRSRRLCSEEFPRQGLVASSAFPLCASLHI